VKHDRAPRAFSDGARAGLVSGQPLHPPRSARHPVRQTFNRLTALRTSQQGRLFAPFVAGRHCAAHGIRLLVIVEKAARPPQARGAFDEGEDRHFKGRLATGRFERFGGSLGQGGRRRAATIAAVGWALA